MARETKGLAGRVAKLPPHLKREVGDFLRTLDERDGRAPQGRLRLDWRGALENLRERYSSTVLAHRGAGWGEE